MANTGWEHERDWATIRPFVYYQLENFVDRAAVKGKDVVDFSAGLGDLSEYIGTLEPTSLLATAHAPSAPRPDRLPSGAAWVAGVGAQDVADRLEPASADVILARMVIQFPTMEHDTVDVDDILTQMSTVLRPGGQIVVSTHAFFDLPHKKTDAEDLDAYLNAAHEEAARLAQSNEPAVRATAEEAVGRIELVRYLGLPPREGPFGTTGFGLKVSMLIQSFLRAGYWIDMVEDLEPFTYPYALAETKLADVTELGESFMERKRVAVATDGYRDIYRRPAILGSLLTDLRALTPVTAVPIVRVVASRAGD